MSTVEEIEVLQKAIVEFHTEKPHSKLRKDILMRTVSELQKVTLEPKSHWNRTRVRTWFWNHRDEVPKLYSGKRKVKHNEEPPSKKAKIDKKLIQQQDDELADGYKTDPDSDIEMLEKRGNNIKMINFASERVTAALNYLQPEQTHTLEYITSNIKFYRIFACCAIGPDVSPVERWRTQTSGCLAFMNDRGRIRWKHDAEFNTFSGKFSVLPGSDVLHEPSNVGKISRYIMFGKVGSEVMRNRNCWYKDHFYCFFRMVGSTNIDQLNAGTESKWNQDVQVFGEDSLNSKQQKERLSFRVGDVVGELQLNSAAGRLCGIRIFARPLPITSISALSFTEQGTILRTLQDSLLNQYTIS